jgi:hypothetical protein
MTLVAHIIPANGGRKVEKPLNKGLGKLALGAGEKIEIVDSATGAHVQAYSVKAHGKGLMLKFAMPEGDVALELSGDISAFAAVAADDAAAADAAADQSNDGAAEDSSSEDRAAAQGEGGSGGFSPVLLGVLGVGALGGIAAALSGGKKNEPADTTAPAAPSALDLAAADDSGLSDSDNITRNTSGLTITGTAEAGARVELFNGATSIGSGTANASGQFSIDVSLAQGTHSITAKATDAADNVGAASSPLSIVVDTTGPTATIALSSAVLEEGDTATVTISFSEAVTDFTLDDLTAPSGTLSGLQTSDGGLTWTATFTPGVDVSDVTNVITLGTNYTDIAGNSGTAATSANYSVDTLTFTVQPNLDGTVDFGGTASGPITLTLNAQDQAIFSRGGKTAETVIPSISLKTMNVPQGGQLNIVIDGAASADTFTLDAPNASTLVFTGNGGGLSDVLNIIIQSATDDPDLRTLTIDTSGLTGVETIRFVFPEDARDVVRLAADSDLSGFSVIEVSKGGLDLSAVNVQPGVEFIVNSTLYLTLAQFEAMNSLVSVTGLGNLVINLTEEEVNSGALEDFLTGLGSKPILIGTTVTVRDHNGDLQDLPDALDAISYPGIPEISDRLDALEAMVANLGIDDIAELADALAALNTALATLISMTEEGGTIDTRLAALEEQLEGINSTVIAYVDAQIRLILNDGVGEDSPSLNSIAGLRAAIEALLDGSNLGDPTVEGTLAYQLASLQSQIDAILDAMDTTAPTVAEIYLDSAIGADIYDVLNAGDVVTYKVHFSEVVLVGGAPTLQLIIGDGEDAHTVEATLMGGAGTDTLTFSYTITEYDYDLSGISIGEDALQLNNGLITDVAGNAVDVSHGGLVDHGYIIDNGPKSLTLRAGAIFKDSNYSSDLVVGVLYFDNDLDNSTTITLDQLDADGTYIVPEGYQFLTVDSYFRVFAAQGEDRDELFMEYALQAGDTAHFALDDLLVGLEIRGLISEEGLRFALAHYHWENFDLSDGLTADQYIQRYTLPLDQLEMAGGSVLADWFVDEIAGHNPAEILLDVTSPLTVAQAAALAAAGFDMESNVNFDIRDYYVHPERDG